MGTGQNHMEITNSKNNKHLKLSIQVRLDGLSLYSKLCQQRDTLVQIHQFFKRIQSGKNTGANRIDL